MKLNTAQKKLNRNLANQPDILVTVTPLEPTKEYLLTMIETRECSLCFHRVIWRAKDPPPSICPACSGTRHPM